MLSDERLGIHPSQHQSMHEVQIWATHRVAGYDQESYNVVQDALKLVKVRLLGIMHEKANRINGKGNIRASKSKILKFTG